MVVLNRIYTRTGDDGTTALGSGDRRKKYDLRVSAYGTLDEVNAVIGVARLHTAGDKAIDAALARIQNDLFDVEAELCLATKGPGGAALTVTAVQVAWLEGEIDRFNESLAPLKSFVLPGGSPAAAYLHLARTICRRAERIMVELRDLPGEEVSADALKYVNRLSDLLFVASRFMNGRGETDVLWAPGQKIGERDPMVMPLYDDNPFKLPHTPVVSWGLIAFTIVAFIFEFSANDNPTVIANQFGVIPAAVAHGYHFPGAINPYLTLVTYEFLHADIVHLIGNLIFLWVFADNVEQALGRVRFLAFYILVGIIGAGAFVLSDPGSRVPLIGASGSISGVVIAYLMLRPCAKLTALVLGIPLRISAYWIIGVFIAIQFISLGSAGKSDVAWWCHVGGMIAGGVLFPLMKLPGVKLFECIRPGDIVLESPSTMHGSPHLPRHIPRRLERLGHVDPGPVRH